MADIVTDYAAAAAQRQVLPPVPPYAEHHSRAACSRVATDVDFELLQLFARTTHGPVQLSARQLAALVNYAGYCHQPLNQLLGWQLLTALEAIAAVNASALATDEVRSPRACMCRASSPPVPCCYGHAVVAQVAALYVSVITQLEAVSGISHWALYVAAHMPTGVLREEVMHSLLSRHAPDWAATSHATRGFIIHALGIPGDHVAAALAQWAGYCNSPEGGVCSLQRLHITVARSSVPHGCRLGSCSRPSLQLHDRCCAAEHVVQLIDANKWKAAYNVGLFNFLHKTLSKLS